MTRRIELFIELDESKLNIREDLLMDISFLKLQFIKPNVYQDDVKEDKKSLIMFSNSQTKLAV